MTPRRERWAECAVAAVLLAAVAVPFWSGRYLPFLDLPQHLGLAAVIARHGDASTAFARYYTVDLGVTPYWGYYGPMWALARLVPIEVANKLVFSAYAVSVPLAVAYLLASFGRDRRWAVLSLPLVFSTNLFFGFATFLISIPLFLFGLGAAERHLSAPRTRSLHAFAAGVLASLVFLAHAQTYLLLGACIIVLLAIHARGARGVALSALPFVLSIALFAMWFAGNFLDSSRAGAEIHTPHWHRYGTFGKLGAVYEPWAVVVRTIPERLLGAFTDRSDTRIGIALAAVFVAAWACDRLVAPSGDVGGPPAGRGGQAPPDAPHRAAAGAPFRTWAIGRRRGVLVALLLAAYLFTPIEVSGQWYLNPRYLVFAALAVPLLIRAPARGWRLAFVVLAAVLGVAASLNTAAKVRQFQEQVGGFDAVARALPPGGRVLGLPFDLGASGPVRLWPLLHWACWQQVLAGGDVGFSFAGLPSIPVRYRTGMQGPHPYEWRPDQFDWSSMGPWYDAFLVSGAPRGRGGAELERNAEPVVRAGTWSLWRPRNRLTHRPPSSR